jgi:hypothetical protein
MEFWDPEWRRQYTDWATGLNIRNSVPFKSKSVSLFRKYLTCLGARSTSYASVNGCILLGVKWPEHKADQSSLSSNWVKNLWSYTFRDQ